MVQGVSLKAYRHETDNSNLEQLIRRHFGIPLNSTMNALLILSCLLGMVFNILDFNLSHSKMHSQMLFESDILSLYNSSIYRPYV